MGPVEIWGPAWQRWGLVLIGGGLLGLGLGEPAYRVGGGVFFWAFIGFFVPMVFVANRYGVLRRPRSLRWTGGGFFRTEAAPVFRGSRLAGRHDRALDS